MYFTAVPPLCGALVASKTNGRPGKGQPPRNAARRFRRWTARADPVNTCAMDARAAEVVLELAESAGPGLAGLDRKASFEQLEERHDDLLAAMEWFLDESRTDE